MGEGTAPSGSRKRGVSMAFRFTIRIRLVASRSSVPRTGLPPNRCGRIINSWGPVYAFEQKTGNVRWKYRAGAGVMADLVRDENRLFAVTLGDELVRLDLSNGRPRWRFSSGWVNEKMTNVAASPVVNEGWVLFGGPNGVVHALDARSGRLIWKRDVGAAVVTPLVVASGALYFGTFDRRLHRLALDPITRHRDVESRFPTSSASTTSGIRRGRPSPFVRSGSLHVRSELGSPV